MENEGIPNVAVPVKIAGRAILNAAWFRRLKLIKLLVLGGDNVNTQNEDGQTPLVLTILSTHQDANTATKEEVVKYLLEQGADTNAKDKFGQIALIHACKEKCSYEVIKLLLDYGSVPTLDDKFGRNSLHIAAQNGDSSILNLMARHCKALGKEVIIIAQKDHAVTSTGKSLSGQENVKTGESSKSDRPLNLKATLAVPFETANTDQQREGVSGKCVFGSPRPKTRFQHDMDNSADSKEGNQSFSLSVNTIPEMNDTWIPRSAPQYSKLTDCPSDLHKLSLGEGKLTQTNKWAEPGGHQAHQQKILKRRATTMALSSPSAALPLPTPASQSQEGKATTHQVTDLKSVKSQLLEWEKELSKAHHYSQQQKIGGLDMGLPLSQEIAMKNERYRGSTDTKICDDDLQKASTSGVVLPLISKRKPPQSDTLVSHSRDSAISSGDDTDENVEISDLQSAVHNKETRYSRSRLVGPGGKVLERKGSATKLLDRISYTRPGTLPPLNVNLNHPVPGIGVCKSANASPHASVSEKLDTLGDDGPPDAEGMTPRQRLISLNPKRGFFNKRSQTIHMGDMQRLLSLNDHLGFTTPTVNELKE